MIDKDKLINEIEEAMGKAKPHKIVYYVLKNLLTNIKNGKYDKERCDERCIS